MRGDLMDFLACTLRNFMITDYKEPIEIKNKDDLLFYVLFQEPELLSIPQSFNYSIRFGIEEVNRVITNYVAFGKMDVSENDNNKRRILVNNFYAKCQCFSNALWFVKDNSVTPYFTTISSNTEIEPESLRRNVYYSNSETTYDTQIAFTIEEIQESMEWYDITSKFLPRVESNKINFSGKELTNMSNYLKFNIPSFQRAYFFLDNARKIDFLPSKIASYISVLESLYAVEGDNKHKTSERTAFLIGKNTKDRIDIYGDISEAYNARSKYVHGAFIADDRHSKLPEISKKLDDYVRRVYKELLLNHPDFNYNSGKNQKVDQKFNEFILSGDEN